MLYPKNQSAQLDEELFKNPTGEYRAAPFWAWNCDLNQELLNREIDVMQKMGMGGFHMHVRVGMSTPYLSEDFFRYIRGCIDKAKENHMLAWLYDEDKWPSGFAGGLVTENPEYRQKYLLLTPNAKPADENGVLLGCYEIRLDDRGILKDYRMLADGEDVAAEYKWYAWLNTMPAGPWFHFKGYVDTMNADAIASFIHITHDRYWETVGQDFGGTCPAIFTDEPQMTRKTELMFASERQNIVLSYTPRFEESYRATYGESFLEHLPEVVWQTESGVSAVRYRYYDHATELFARAFSDQIGAWCRQKGILMTGHMMEEPTLRSQTCAIGECMRSYRGFTLPGVDMLCDYREFNTVKQCASASHQRGCEGVLSELYGVTNWDYDFRGHKLQGDWQAALGVSVRVPHLYWVSMHGESKRDYPASIGHQSCWWTEYSYIENHFARVNTLMTRGKPRVRVGVIHPIESYWIHYGPADQTGAKREELDRRFAELTSWLLLNTIDFDFICESELPSQYRENEPNFTVGNMHYQTVIVPCCDTLRTTTLQSLKSFRKKGGTVLFMGSIPKYADALPSNEIMNFAKECTCIPWEKCELLQELLPNRDLSVTDEKGLPSSGILYGMREDGENRNLFLCHAFPDDHRKVEQEEHYRVSLNGCWKATLYQTLSGEILPMPVEYENRQTVFNWNCFPQDSLLLRLEPVDDKTAPKNSRNVKEDEVFKIRMLEEYQIGQQNQQAAVLSDPVPFILHEDNVCVLDMAQWRIDDNPWQPKEEMLRIGVLAKDRLQLSTAAVSGAQPWILPKEKPEHSLTVRSSFIADIVPDVAYLALEDADESEVWLNDDPVVIHKQGYYVDEAITRIALPKLRIGENTITVRKPLVTASSVENFFLLGAFGVTLQGREMHITDMPKELSFGDWTVQGLPFYGGPLTYRFTVVGGQSVKLRLGRIAAPCTVVDLDGVRIGNLSLAPHEVNLGDLTEGEHILDITVFASRINTFGPLHLNDEALDWFGPQAWRTSGMDWTYAYRLKPVGMLSEPWLIKT